MGDGPRRALRVQFDSKLKIEFHNTMITSDAGLLAFRELDEAFRFEGVVRQEPAACDVGHPVATSERRGRLFGAQG